jgi:hypothetical protein
MARFEGFQHEFVEVAAPAMSTDALYELGVLYCAGREVGLDLVAAHKWFNIAAARGNKDARLRRSEISLEMTREQISKAQREARAWLAAH